ncbi:MAG: hypothetical protein ACOC6B_07220 [Thermodesulfobacteriota bacterium]
MEQIVDVLLRKLAQKGVYPDEVPWLVRDALTAVAETGNRVLNTVNRRLALLGWDEEILDEVTFELIIYLVEEGDEQSSRVTGTGENMMKNIFIVADNRKEKRDLSELLRLLFPECEIQIISNHDFALQENSAINQDG